MSRSIQVSDLLLVPGLCISETSPQLSVSVICYLQFAKHLKNTLAFL